MGFLNRLFGAKTTVQDDHQNLIERSMEELRGKTAFHDNSWQIGDASWNVSQDDEVIIFTRPDGSVATAPVQIIGTYNQADSSWLWGWNHPSVVPALQEHASVVRNYAQQNGIQSLLQQSVSCSEQEAWEYTALACKLADAQGAYRGLAGTTAIFMTFGEVSLSK